MSKKLRQDLNQYYFLDIDMDYFTLDADNVHPTIIKDEEIKDFCDFSNPIFGLMKDRLVGVTIALEPNYCGGLENSLLIYSLFNKGILSLIGRN